jgi:hypothetical protein
VEDAAKTAPPGSAPRGAPAAAPAPALKTRPPELEDWLNRFVVHPLSRRIALALRHTPVSPNMVSVSSGLSIAAAAAAYTLLGWPQAVAAGLFFHLLWHVLDGADGDLARLTGKSSPLGETVDGLADYSGHAVLYISLAAYEGGWVWALATLAAFSRGLQANHIESVRRNYLWRAYGIPWLGSGGAQAESDSAHSAARRSLGARVLNALSRFYLAAGDMVSPRGEAADGRIEALAADPATAASARSAARRVGASALRWQEWLGPNRRTLLLGASMALGTPIWFLALEATLLNLVLVASIRRQRKVNQALAAALEQVGRTA